MADSNVSLNTTTGPSKDRKDDQGLPWYFDELTPSAELIGEIVG